MSGNEIDMGGDLGGGRSGGGGGGAQGWVLAVVTNLVALGLGLVVGVSFGAEAPQELSAEIGALRSQLRDSQAKVAELERTLQYKQTANNGPKGKLSKQDRLRLQRNGRKYVETLRGVKAQSAASLMNWFVGRWEALLDRPEADDRVTRRAATLSLLVGGMAENLNPEDYVPWQAEFLSGNWLGELHFDIDGDGLPGSRHQPNPKDGFADVSVCHIAMALNQAVTDAQVLVMPELQCDRPYARMSLFLQGRTFDDALDEFARALKAEGFLVRQRRSKGTRLLLVGAGSRRKRR